MSLCERKLEILDSLLSCEEIQPVVMKLVSLSECTRTMYMYSWVDTRTVTMCASSRYMYMLIALIELSLLFLCFGR